MYEIMRKNSMMFIIRKFVAEKQHDVYKEKCFTNIFRHAWV